MILFIIFIVMSLVLLLFSVYLFRSTNIAIMLVSGILIVMTGIGLLADKIKINSSSYVETFVYEFNSSNIVSKTVEFIPYNMSSGFERLVPIVLIGFGLFLLFAFMQDWINSRRSNN